MSLLVGLALLLAVLAMARPLDHDESQYVAAAAFVARGFVPYRDFAYLQTPLQPYLFAPLGWVAGMWLWPALRLANALLGAMAAAFVYRAAREARAGEGAALAAAGLFAACDVFLFSVGTARNDALPCALLAAALPLVVRAGDGCGTRGAAMLAGLLLAGAAGAKLSYALPALAYAAFALVDRRHRPGWVVLGALPVIAFAVWHARFAGFWFGAITFPMVAPEQYYRAIGKAWKLGWGAKLLDFSKFLALGPALPALLIATRFRWAKGARVLDWMLVAAVLAALAPAPTWRQYLLPMLPMLFVRLGVGWTLRPPTARGRAAIAAFACAGVAPTLAALAMRAPAMPEAMRQTRAVAAALDRAGVGDGVVTLSPQLLGARLPDARFAAGPFYFRSAGLLPADQAARLHLIARGDLARLGRPPAILTGAEAWTSGDAGLDAALARWAEERGYARQALPGGRLWLWISPSHRHFRRVPESTAPRTTV